MISPKGDLEAADSIYVSGFFVRDAAMDSNFFHLGGITINEGNGLTYNASDDDLGINLQAVFTGHSNRIEVDIKLIDLTGNNRALTLYFALPIDVEDWIWGDDIRNSRTITSNSQMRNTIDVGFGSNGLMSRYPIASVSGTDGIALGYPLDSPAQIRLTANSATRQLYIAFDVALSPLTKEPGKTHLKAVIFRYDPEWGFRAAIKKYYELYPAFFEKRVDKEGIWVAFSDLSSIPKIEDFGIVFHELGGTYQIAFDNTADIYSLRYLTEPWSYWMHMPEEIPNDDYDQVMAYLISQLNSSDKGSRLWAEVTLSSGSFDKNGNYRFKPAEKSWCPYGVVFTLNPTPDIEDLEYSLNKAHLSWNDNSRSIYTNANVGILDGEYIDSVESLSTVLDYRESHITAANLPLVYDSTNFRPSVPEIFTTYEFLRWLEKDIHRIGKLMMANWILREFAFPAHIFDIMGTEIYWLSSGEYHPDKDTTFNFRRTLSYQKPYCLDLHADFSQLTHEFLERYFRTSLFYGVYPSMGAHNYSLRYWETPGFYEKDRDIFKKYIPLIRTLGEAGWEPITYAVSSESNIYVERYGTGESLYITTRNETEQTLTYELSIEAEPLELPLEADIIFEDLLSGDTFTVTSDGANLTLADTLEPDSVRMFHLIK